MNKNRIIFLDIDGVLNSVNWYKKRIYKTTFPRDKDEFDPKAIKLLNKIIDATNAKIVISSTWRYGKSVGWFNQLFNKIKLNGSVIGMTKIFHHYKFNVPRGVEIKQYYSDHYNHPSYFDDAHSKLYSYIILDDDSDMLYEQRNNFLKINNQFGLTNEDVPKAIDILMKALPIKGEKK